MSSRASVRSVEVFDAPREVVFAAWTEPELLQRWWGPGVFEHGEVLDDRRQRHLERLGQLAHRRRTRGEALGDRAARRIGQRAEDRVETRRPILNHSVQYNRRERRELAPRTTVAQNAE